MKPPYHEMADAIKNGEGVPGVMRALKRPGRADAGDA